MSSFAVRQEHTTTNSPNNTLGTSVLAGSILVAIWEGGTSTGGSPSLPTSLSDDNSNVYDLVSFTQQYSPAQATTGIYVCFQPNLTLHNPPTLETSGAGGVPPGGPTIFFLEVTVPAAYVISGSLCNRNSTPGSPVVLSVGQLGGAGPNWY